MPNPNAYLEVKIAQIDAELKKLSKQRAALVDRKKGYESQLQKQPVTPAQ